MPSLSRNEARKDVTYTWMVLYWSSRQTYPVVLPQVAKLLERFQLDLNKHELEIADNQHAFLRDRSTTQAWFYATDLGCETGGVHIVFVDFRKVFDLIDHAILLTKLAASSVNRGF